MAHAVLLLLGLFWSLAHSQRVPYVSFMGQTLANHSYVDLSLVGDDGSGSDSVQCITDLSTCCSIYQGPTHRGDWYFPDGTRLPFSGGDGLYETRGPQRVDLRRRNSATSPTVGIYRCGIPTNDVHDDNDRSVGDTVYVGLYTASGGNANWKSLYKQDCHWLTIIYRPQIYYFSCLYSSPIMSLHSVPPFYLLL